jgi:hypothetical protein
MEEQAIEGAPMAELRTAIMASLKWTTAIVIGVIVVGACVYAVFTIATPREVQVELWRRVGISTAAFGREADQERYSAQQEVWPDFSSIVTWVMECGHCETYQQLPLRIQEGFMMPDGYAVGSMRPLYVERNRRFDPRVARELIQLADEERAEKWRSALPRISM